MVMDPVCGMAVDRKNPPARSEYKGVEYLFCATDCKRKFEENPTRYISSTSSPAVDRRSGLNA